MDKQNNDHDLHYESMYLITCYYFEVYYSHYITTTITLLLQVLHISQGLTTEHAVFGADATVTKKNLEQDQAAARDHKVGLWVLFFHFYTNWLT